MLKVRCNAVDMYFIRFSKAVKTLVCLAMDIVLLLLCPFAYN